MDAEKRVPALDGVRGLAIFLVLIHHGIFFIPTNSVEELFEQLLGGWNGWGWIGVDLFFVLSGYLITGILLRSCAKPNYFVNFYARRSLRIFPLYFASLAVLFFLLPLAWKAMIGVKPEDQIWYWTYSMNIFYGVNGNIPLWMSHFWSLCIEEHFYLVWPLIVLLCSRRLPWVCTGLIAGSLILRIAFFVGGGKPLGTYCLTITRMDGLALGGLIAALERSSMILSSLRRSSIWVFFGLGGYLIILAILTSGLHPLSWQVLLYGITPVAFFWGAGIVILVTSSPESRLVRVLSQPVLTVLGKYSYSLYVVHMPILCFLHNWLAVDDLGFVTLLPSIGGTQIPMVVLQVFLLIVCSFILSIISYHLLEKHFLNLKHYFSPRKIDLAAALPTAASQNKPLRREIPTRAA